MRLLTALLALCLSGTAVILVVSRIFLGGVLKEPTTVDIQYDVPAQVIVEEPFSVTLKLTNVITASQTLHSIDIDTRLWEIVHLNGSMPPYSESRMLPLTRFESFLFEEEIPVDGSTEVTLQFVGASVGRYEGVLDVCLEDGTFCVALPLETAVVEK
ncbi:MAG: hypothetical protein DHS20C20_03030 [Ardenticatenaceae bacterium]|nr:MAG: hypothetical protein DHS20C20_03030 [Ardenticatenaceae bacterium]